MTNGTMIARALRRVIDQPLTLRLYVATGSGQENEIVELSGNGYQSRLYTLVDWLITPGIPAIAEAPVHDFRFSGNKRMTVLGAYMTQADGGILWVDPFPSALEIGRSGDIIPVRPMIKMGSFGITTM